MTANRREQLRQIMLLAWQKLHWERRTMGRLCYAMVDALRHAWAWSKGAAKREAEAAAAKVAWDQTGGVAGVTFLRSPVRSAIRRSLTGQRFAASKDFSAAYTTVRVGI